MTACGIPRRGDQIRVACGGSAPPACGAFFGHRARRTPDTCRVERSTSPSPRMSLHREQRREITGTNSAAARPPVTRCAPITCRGDASDGGCSGRRPSGASRFSRPPTRVLCALGGELHTNRPTHAETADERFSEGNNAVVGRSDRARTSVRRRDLVGWRPRVSRPERPPARSRQAAEPNTRVASSKFKVQSSKFKVQSLVLS
jgi:hypothetical protein